MAAVIVPQLFLVAGAGLVGGLALLAKGFAGYRRADRVEGIASSNNGVVALRRRIDRAWANIDVALRQRYDELPNLVAAVSGVMAFERGVLDEVARQRARYQPAAAPREQARTADATTVAVRSLLAVVEAYPELRSQANVLALQQEIERLEELIAGRRELYNDQVYRYNATIQQVPAVLLAGAFGWRSIDFFATTPETAARPSAGLQPS